MLSALGLDTFFETLVIGAECSRAKPHPEPYLEGMRRLGVDAAHCVAFEDSPSGMTSAVAAGLPTFGVLTSQSCEALRAAGAVACIADFRDAALWAALGEAPPAEA
jgi:beta-phosphoglucomutase-like phosphatase (HAD superfamily)